MPAPMRALLLPAVGLAVASLPDRDVVSGCQMDVPGAEYIGGNLHDKHHPNTTRTHAGCCTLCQEADGCVLWTWSPMCWSNMTNCCWLKTAEAWAGRRVEKAGTSYSGSTHALPPAPAPAGDVVYRCVGGVCVKAGPANGTAFSSPTCNSTCHREIPALSGLGSLRMRMLPVGDVRPAGWLEKQLATQVNGLSGHLERFWPDVRNSTWIYPENRWQETYSDRGGNLPYWLNGVIPMVMQMRGLADRVDSTGYNLTHTVVDHMRRLVATQRQSGSPLNQNFNLGTWNVMRSSLLLMSAMPSEVDLLLPFVLSYIQAAHKRLKSEGWPNGGTLCTACDENHPTCSKVRGGGVCRFRYPDWMHILQQLLDAHASQMTAAERALVLEHMQLIGYWGFDYRSFYSRPCPTHDSPTPCFPMEGCNSAREAANAGCTQPAWHKTNPSDIPAVHGVHGGAMALKEGTVRWRMTHTQADIELDERKVELLERYQGQPTGQFSADEDFAGREARRGVELCTIVETMYSLGSMGQRDADVRYIDRLEKIALNALPAALTADMWSHNYLSMINEVQAVKSQPRVWGDGENATTYGLADRFTGVTPCCTANHNQGWPKLVQFGVQAGLQPGGAEAGAAAAAAAIYVVLLLPTNATMPSELGHAKVSVETSYPFGDEVAVCVAATSAVQLFVRVPEWATAATVSLNGAVPAPAKPNAYHLVSCAADATTILMLNLNPKIIVERHWGDDGINGVAVTRGPLLFALPLDEVTTKLGSPYDKCFESGCSQDVQITSTEHWSYALVLPQGNTGPNSTVIDPPGWTFNKLGSPGRHPFAGRLAPTVAITVEARELPSWTMDAMYIHSPQRLPPSPVDCSACGPPKSLQLVPFGSTRLRVGMLPYTVPPQ